MLHLYLGADFALIPVTQKSARPCGTTLLGPFNAREMFWQGMIDAAGFCCYGVVDAFGVCNGWDASGRIALTLLAKPPSAASATAIAGYLGIDASRLHSVTSDPGCVQSLITFVGPAHNKCAEISTLSKSVQFLSSESQCDSYAILLHQSCIVANFCSVPSSSFHLHVCQMKNCYVLSCHDAMVSWMSQKNVSAMQTPGG